MTESKPEIPGFNLVEKIGTGKNSSVWWAIDHGGFRRAVKIISGDSDRESTLQSIKLFRNAANNDPHLIEILAIGETAKYLYYVMPLADSAYPVQFRYEPVTLKTKIRLGMTYQEISDTFSALLLGVAELHSHGVSHHDLKTENIIFVNNIPKIADPDLCCDIDDVNENGTPGYRPDNFVNGISFDIFSLRKILYSMYTGLPPESFPDLPRILPDRRFRELNLIALKCCTGGESFLSVGELAASFKKLSAKYPDKKIIKTFFNRFF